MRLPDPIASDIPQWDARASHLWLAHTQRQDNWLRDEVGRQMHERLSVIKQAPQAWLDVRPDIGGLAVHRMVSDHYPQAQAWMDTPSGVVRSNATPATALKQWVRRLPLVGKQPATPSAHDMVWANMVLHTHTQPKVLLAQWHDQLTVDGFVMFSALGPDTGKEWVATYQALGLPPAQAPWTDMHDWGDMLIEVGFSQPVMDVQRWVLTYPSIERMLIDLRGVCKNQHAERSTRTRGRETHRRWLADVSAAWPHRPEGLYAVTVEVVFGHAIKPVPVAKVQPVATLSLDDMRQQLKRGQV